MTESERLPDQLDFDSAAIDPDERFARYRTLYQGGADVSLTGSAFAVHVRGWRLARAMMFDRWMNGVAHTRTLDRAGRDGFDHFTLTLVLAGDYEIDVGDGPQRIEPGQGVLLDMLQPTANRSTDVHLLTASLARDRVAAAAMGATDDLHNRVLAGPGTALLIDYALALVARLDTLAETAHAPAIDALVSLVALALGAPAGLDDQARQAARRAGQIRAIIDRHIGEAGFDTNDLMRLSGLSRSTLYRVLADRGGVAGFIQDRRLEYLRRRLLDPEETRPFAALAYAAGFASESHASSAFLDRFGLRPSQYRRAHGLFDDPADPGLRLRHWLDEVR